ncbi:glycoside hydrolase family 130 protein [Roseivirga echinicomitans]|uniref:Pesticidal protein Cry7Aa n=1 Tax=Roseivirga echinicomitans TaxID=296218 RepID=A0A150XV52_9BACT|nr:pesticidal protein Cry7Aa [Roseivirga echinicomitans]KYG82620.1 pesticidal protein Cry7Aa [Roseivirga echinicomitans]
MLKAKKHGVILDKTKLGFENAGVFNPAVIQSNDKTHLFYRAVRTGNYSSIGYAELDSPIRVRNRSKKPLLIPEHPWESQGMEDPRIAKIGDTFYMTYTAYNKINALGALATSKDLKHFEKQGTITPQFTYREYNHLVECCPKLNDKYFFHYKIFKEHGLGPEVAEKLLVWDKNLMFFPKKINGKFALLHRIHPGIQMVYFNQLSDLNLKFWTDYFMSLDQHIVLDPELEHESSHIGGGCPPIETPEGWLLIYHAAQDTPKGFMYHACAALLDLNDPKIEIARLPYPLISPTFEWEKEGFVNNIIFPSGAIVEDGLVYIYYGAADERVAVASVPLQDLVTELLNYKQP